MKISGMSVELVDSMGTDLTVVNSARVSFDKVSEWEQVGESSSADLESRTVMYMPHLALSEKDAKLISYLAKHNHWTPFGHATLSFRIKAPIFVARQLVKHQVGLVWNEVSRRYVDDEPEFWFPSEWRGKPVNAKQGSNGKVEVYTPFETYVGEALNCYQSLLSEGVAPEQARMVLPLNTMTEWIWTGSLFAFARVCNLRLDPHAQQETRDIAIGIDVRARQLFPVSWKALVDDKTTIA